MDDVAITRLSEAMGDYADRAAAALEAEGRGAQNILAVTPGVTPAWDSSCSQLYGRVVQIQPHVDRGTPAAGAGCAVSYYIATVALAVTRCVKTMEPGRGRVILPSPDEVVADGVTMLRDLATLEQVIRCNPRTLSIVGGQPLPEMGGMAGFEWVYRMRIMHCGCPAGT